MNQSTSAQQHWRSVLVQFVGSKLSAAAFCHYEGITQSTFSAWRKRLLMAN
jgi:hypothetical protein